MIAAAAGTAAVFALALLTNSMSTRDVVATFAGVTGSVALLMFFGFEALDAVRGGDSYIGELIERRRLQRAAASRDPFRGLTPTEDDGDT
ncbi:hypothetical protein [Candidatus Poriferisodalis sp.]|uniref:hypothetical protein n=1 Tax=Candidatus Poriferisodalis sp. TaxID=3101277 RepID=UPI003B010C51